MLFPHPRRRDWNDVSDYVVHLTRDSGPVAAADSFVSILQEGTLRARTRFGIGRRYELCRPSVCLTEAPPHELRRIAERRSVFGLGFLKGLAIHFGGGPVSYLYGDRATAAETLMQRATADPDDPIWTLAPLLEGPVVGNSFEWEREWRVPQDLPFSPAQVQFLTGPEEEHADMRSFLIERAREHDFMDYSRRPLIDLNWDNDRIRRELMFP